MLSRRNALSALAGAVVWPFDSAQADAPLRRTRPMFGSPADVIVRPARGGAVAADRAVDAAMAGLERLNREWNAWKPGELGRLNAALVQGRSERVAPDLLALIRLSQVMERRTGGLFNAGIGGIVGAWGFHDDVMRPGQRPSAAVLAPWRHAAPSLSQLVVEGDRVRCDHPWLRLDFGGIAKGVAIDQALDRLAEHGVRDAVVNLGGNLATRGSAGGRPWQIGIRDPQGEGLVALVATHEREAVVTSGSYERFRVLDGERMTHIIDPRLGEPAPGLVSVTVLHPSAAFADAAATALLVAGPGGWRTLAERLDLRQVLVIGADGRGAVTAALASRLAFAAPRWTSRLTVVG
ncbi:FAD:protein FMN transferase [Hydrogenophaga sp. RWCD_12]|uniref:FAD:protein FMN transferase n=1 Tax=Hydrogenophaga sp. RWCD_12 TaxID=3391190 RepID=UPI003984B332